MIGILLLGLFCGVLPLQAAFPVVTTTTDLQALVQVVGGERVAVTSIGKGHEDPHFIEPKPSFLMNLSRARLLFCIGLDLEIWLKPLLEGARNLAITPGNRGYVDCSQAIEIREVPQVRVDPSMGDVHPLGNPHYWLAPENTIHVARLIARKLTETDPEGAAVFQKNLHTFETDMMARIPAWKERFAGLKNRTVVGFHSSWVYCAEAFGLEIIGFVEPRPGVPPTGREIAGLVSLMKSRSCRTILREKYHSDRFANLAAEKAGGSVLVLPTSIGAEAGIKSFPDLFDTLTQRISAALAVQP
jgi:ABC-type Zn uptake system ZnuABC Zn-binding protein ZnuA